MNKRFLLGAIPLIILIMLLFTDSCTNPLWPKPPAGATQGITLGRIPDITPGYSGPRVLSPIDDNVAIVIKGLPAGVTADLVLETDLEADYKGIDFDPDTNTLSYTNDDEPGYNGTMTIEFSVIMVSIPDSEPITLTIDVDRYDGRDEKLRIPVTHENIVRFNKYATDEETKADGLARHYKLMENVDLFEATPLADGSNWTAIGTGPGAAFTGSFDGQGHKISNLSIKKTTTNVPANNYQGMFGYINKGIVKNLGLAGGSIAGSTNVGGVAGYSMGGTIQNCYTTGIVTGFDQVGGIVGYNNSATVQYCYTEGTITSTGSNSKVGGIAGTNTGTNATAAKVVNCYSIGGVLHIDAKTGWAGGVVGYNDLAIVRYCYAKGSVTNGYYVGGIVGQSVFYTASSTPSPNNQVNSNVALNLSLSTPYTYTPDTTKNTVYIRGIFGDAAAGNGHSPNYSQDGMKITYGSSNYQKPYDTNQWGPFYDGVLKSVTDLKSKTWWQSKDTTIWPSPWDFNKVWVWNDKGGTTPFAPPTLQNMPAR